MAGHDFTSAQMIAVLVLSLVCGIAGDYCVKETLKNLYEKSPNNIFVFEDGIASIDGGKALNEYVEEKHIMKSKLW